MPTASAPGKVILLGEHAVVYGKLGIAAAIDRRMSATVQPACSGIDFGEFKSDRKEMEESLREFRTAAAAKDSKALEGMGWKGALKAMVAEAADRWGWKDITVTRGETVPLKGTGSSSGSFAAIARAYAALMGVSPSPNEISELAYIGDCIVHAGIPSGIDNSAVSFGGYLTYTKNEGPSPLNFQFNPTVVVVNTGEPVSTAEMVGKVRRLREREPQMVDRMMDEIDRISRSGLGAIRDGDPARLGSLMYENHSILQKLGVSTPKLDLIVYIARREGALGAKLTGAGGGGTAIVLTRNDTQACMLAERYNRSGFPAVVTSLGAPGVRLEKG